MFSGPAWLVAQFYALTNSYGIAIGMVALVVMLLVTPLTLKSTKGMLEMQRLQPEMKRLQAQHRGDRQKLNEEMMKLYQEHKVNPLASCLPLLLQMPVFFIMYRVLRELSHRGADGTFDPRYISKTSELYLSLDPRTEMLSFGLDLSRTPAHFIGESFGKGLVYAFLVVFLAALYFIQQKMVASRAAASPTMSATQAKLMQYLPVAFAVFQIFFLTGLVIYYIIQTLFRIAQNAYITRRFYHGEESLGQLAQAAGARAREEAKANGTDTSGPGGMFAQAKRDAQARREGQDAARKGATSTGRPSSKGQATTKSATKEGSKQEPATEKPVPSVISKRVTPPKNRPTPSSSRPQRPMASGRSGAPARPKPPKK
ncbi:MAG: YidC/Oxa1 family membrane protein insertase [Ilumatobacteraceae bacterium]